MAIYPTIPSSPTGSSAPGAINIEAWTEQATQSLQAIAISPLPQSRSVSLTIPLDERTATHREALDSKATAAPTKGDAATYRPRREPLRRDSLKRREALLKGKEGSRRRQRWENDRLLSNPWAQPPLPSDWEVHPTYPRHAVPYYLAPLWDADMAARASARRRKGGMKAKGEKEEETAAGRVLRELRETLKRARGAKGLLQDLEEDVRMFVRKWEERGMKAGREEEEEEVQVDSEDEEIVFVGRHGHYGDQAPSPSQSNAEDLEKDKLVFDSLVDDHGASFGRWLVHSIASYYGLRTWSVTVGDPARREAYVGIDEVKAKNDRRPVSPEGSLPRPLWVMV
ncbi:hypothetical protein MMC16_005187 [Acarospora aff. strigata]|nr:hypothetical protein [Acarospora aff. strigata]